MILLSSTSDLVRLTTSAAVTVDVHASYVDNLNGAVTPGRTNTNISTQTTTTIVSAPAANAYRTVKTITARNRHASTAVDVTIIHTDGTTAPELIKATLQPEYALHYDEHNGWTTRDGLGRIIERIDNLLATTSVDFITVALASDVTNSDAVANTMADVTGLSFPVVSGSTYWFRFMIVYTAAATATGSRWSINGPATSLLMYKSEYSLTVTSRTINEGLSAYDSPAAASATSAATTANTAWIEGFVTPSADGTVIARFASEVSGSAIVAKAGSILHYQQVL